ncbi:MAG: leucine-rich repeat protein [Christensenellales bacterium]
MKKRLVFVIITLFCVMLCAIGFTACGSHSHEYLTEVVAPTCTEQGYTIYTCECGDSYRGDYVSATGHSYGEPEWSWDGYGAATATFTCANDENHVEILTAEVMSEVTSAPSCTSDGEKTYTAIVNFDDQDYTDTRTETLVSIDHNYGEPEWYWDGFEATATFVCENDGNHVEELTAIVTSEVTEEATCTSGGEKLYTATVTFRGRDYTSTKTETLGSIGHSYGEPVWSWDGYDEATATFTCENDGNHVEILPANITIETYRAYCETDGERIYTATVTLNNRQYTATKTETLPKTGHSYGAPIWRWNNFYATVTFPCANNGMHDLTFEPEITDEVTSEPTCTTDGERLYTARIEFDGREYTDTKTEKLQKTGHDYGKPEWIWNGFEATAKFVCINDANHVENLTATVTSEVKSEATCTVDGEKVYTATVDWGYRQYTDTKTEKLPKTGHAYGEPVWNWNGSEAKATFTCSNGASHVDTFYATVTSKVTVQATCEVDGEKEYTATITIGNETYTATKTETLNRLGHSYGEPEWIWNGYEATAKFICTNDGDHVENMAASVTNEVTTEATCTEDGEKVYTASVTFGGKKYTDTKIETLEHTGHNCGVDKICTICGEPYSTEGLSYELNSDGLGYTSIGIGTATDTDIVIAPSIKGLPVTAVKFNAFSGNNKITSVIIPESVTKIGTYAFNKCTALTSVVINGSVAITEGVFWGCTALESVSLSENVTDIGSHAFDSCNSLTSIVIPSKVANIGGFSFQRCTSLREVTIEDGVKTIGSKAFGYCDALESITIPDSVTSVGDYAFLECYSLTSAKFGSSVTGIGQYAFQNCYSLMSVRLGVGVVSIGNNAFENCYKLAEVFNLSSLTITKGSYNYGWVGRYAIDVNTTNGTSKISTDANGYILYTGEDSIYLLGYTGSETSITLPDTGATKLLINNYAFFQCASIESVTLSGSVTAIGNDAFSGCTALKTISIPESVTTIGDRAFTDCIALESITIPESVTNIGAYAFSRCNSLTTVTIPKNVTAINWGTFHYCTNLTSVFIPDSVEKIGREAFNNCTNLTSVFIPGSVKEIAQDAFKACDALRYAFYDGTAENWGKITLNTTVPNVYYYSETEPALNSEGTAYDGNYWHYDTDGITPVAWVK